LVDQPRLDELAEEPLPRDGGLRLQGRQELREVVHGEVERLGKFHER